MFVPLHHRSMLKILGEDSPTVLTPPPPSPQRGGGQGHPLRKLRQKRARRYYKCKYLRAVLHGCNVSNYRPSNRGSHRRILRAKTCVCPGQVRRGKGGGDGAGGKHHGTSTIGLSCWWYLLWMWVPVVLQDRVLRLPSNRPQLRVLSVSGVVSQCRAPYPTGRAAKDSGEAIGRRGEAAWEEAMWVRRGGTEQGARGGYGDGEIKRHEATQRPTTPPPTVGNQREGEDIGRRHNAGKSGRGGRERRWAWVQPDPGGLTSPGGLRRLGPWEPGHSSGRRDKGWREVARVVAWPRSHAITALQSAVQ